MHKPHKNTQFLNYCLSSDARWGQLRSELTLLQNLLHGVPKCYLSITAGQALPGEEIESRCVAAHLPLTFKLSYTERSAASMDGHLKQVWVSCGGASLIVRVTLPRALWPAPSGALPQMLERRTMKTASDLEVVRKQEKLPALLQFSLYLNTHKYILNIYSIISLINVKCFFLPTRTDSLLLFK